MGRPSASPRLAELAQAVQLIESADEICLACHVRPDADALGSMLAVAHALRAPGRRPAHPAQRVIASFGDEPFEVPQILRFLPGTGLLSPPGEYPHRPELMITFDAGSIDRLGLLAGNAARAGEPDRHRPPRLEHPLRHRPPDRPGRRRHRGAGAGPDRPRSASELTRDVAFGLYAGLVTDTGSFKYPATSPAVHTMAARLLGTGIEPGAVARELWDRALFGYLGLLSAVLGRAVLEPAAAGGHGLVWTTISRADRAGHGLSFDAVESVIDVVRRTDEADVAVVLKQSDDGVWQVSARSKGKVDVSRRVRRAGRRRAPLDAAGFASPGPADEIMAAAARTAGGRQLTVARADPPGGPGGLIVVDKPGGMTSHDVVARIRRLAGTRRVGHAGTLDPMATGVLVVGVEKATRLLGHLTLTDKEYLATIRLGQATDTGDAEGTVIAGAPASELPAAAVSAAAAALTGEIQQVPPAVSAIKVAGQAVLPAGPGGRAARARRPAGHRVVASTVLDLRPAGELLDVDVAVRCSSGTYIRALARDMGAALGVGGHLTTLRRTRVGPYDLATARTLDQLADRLERAAAGRRGRGRVPGPAADRRRSASPQPRRAAARTAQAEAQPPTGPVAAFGPDGTLIALVEEKHGLARPLAVFVP